MQKTDLKTLTMPDSPGVYFFLDKNKKVLYIGKATSLKNRVKSYFASNLIETRSALIENMVREAVSIETTVTDSVLEALILETNLIQSHKPRFNTKSKDDKSYNHLIITSEDWPRILVVRGKDITENFADAEIKYHFGPFTSAGLLREALKIIRKLFKYYDTAEPIGEQKTKLAKGKIQFNQQIGLYPNVGDKLEYKKTIKHLRLFFEGKKKQILLEIEKDMMKCAKRQEFEKAAILRKKIFALQHIEDIALVKKEFDQDLSSTSVRIEGYDIAHMGGKNMVGVMTVVQNGEAARNEYRKFKITSVKGANDPAALKETVTRRLEHTEWTMPQIIVVDGNEVQMNVVRKIVQSKKLEIDIIAVVKDDRHKASRLIGNKDLLKKYKFEILLVNAEAHRFAINYYRKLQRKAGLK